MFDQITEKLTSPEAMNFIKSVQQPFKSLPHLPQGAIDFLGSVAPWGAVLGGILGILGGLSALSAAVGLNNPYSYAPWMASFVTINTTSFFVTGISELVMAALSLIAFKHLKDRDMKGWVLLFWIEVVNIVAMILQVLVGGGGFIELIIGTAISMYILSEMQSYFGVMPETVKKIKDATK